MGYMGFGMRKEIYTRKPNEAFGKIKKTFGKHGGPTKLSTGNGALEHYDELMALHKKRFKRKPLRVVLNFMLLLGMLTFFGLFIHYLVSRLEHTSPTF